MRLSEAIRLGAMQYPAAYGPTMTLDDDGNICGVCALGAALVAVGMKPFCVWDDANDALPMLMASAVNPVEKDASIVRNIIIYLFEGAKWTREQIADWVESIERSQEQSTVADASSAQDAVACHVLSRG